VVRAQDRDRAVAPAPLGLAPRARVVEGKVAARAPVSARDRSPTPAWHIPVPISRVLPEYPGNARSQGVEGEVVLRAIVDRQGTVRREIVVVQSVPMLDRAAIEALRQWRFEPGRDAGNRAVPVVIEVPLRFRLR